MAGQGLWCNVLSLKQYHTCYYWFYEKGTMMAMVGIQGLYTPT